MPTTDLVIAVQAPALAAAARVQAQARVVPQHLAVLGGWGQYILRCY